MKRSRRPDAGVGLVELLLVVSLLGALTAPMAALLVQTARTSARLQHSAMATSSLVAAVAISESGLAGPACPDSEQFTANLTARLGLPDTWSVDAVPTCQQPVMVMVTITDPTGAAVQSSMVSGGDEPPSE